MAVMHAGRLVQTGLTDTVLRASLDEYTRALLAAAPRLDGALVCV